MNAQLHTPVVQHDFLHHELHVAFRSDRHAKAVLTMAFQRLLDDADDYASVVDYHRDRDHDALGRVLSCAINDASARYVADHIEQLEANPRDYGDAA